MNISVEKKIQCNRINRRKVIVMFIFSTKLTKTKILTVALVSACLVLLLLISLPTGVSASKDAVKGETNEERISYLETFGWQVSADPVEVVNITIPEKFDQTYNEYNALQQTQGFDLSGYRGDSGTRYTYTVSNYPNKTSSQVLANVIVIDEQIVAADVSSVSAGGFMHSLQMPEKVPTAGDAVNSDTVNREDLMNSLNSPAK